MHDYLQRILANKALEVAALKEHIDIHQAIPRHSEKSFKNNLAKGQAVIAEIKRRSPSKNRLAEIPDPVLLAKQYAMGGASAISVLTDAYGFGGSIKDLQSVVDALSSNSIATLRKDFIIDPVQIVESVNVGADAVLLIVAALKGKTKDLLNFAREMKIDVLIEVMSMDELEYALSLSPDLIAVNNRDLTCFEVDVSRALRMRELIPSDIVTVAASGMDSPEKVREYFEAGYHAVLVGEALVKANNPSQFIQDCKL